jgi:hypothetical protein
MQLSRCGLWRRLPPMLDGDPARVRLVYSLMFSVPGTPVLLLRGGDGDGPKSRPARPDGGALADVVDRSAARWLLPGAGGRAATSGDHGSLWGLDTSMAPSSGGPRVAARAHEVAGARLPALTRAGLGDRGAESRPTAHRRAGPRLPARRPAAGRRPQPRAGATATSPGTSTTGCCELVDVFGDRDVVSDGSGRARMEVEDIRLPVDAVRAPATAKRLV